MPKFARLQNPDGSLARSARRARPVLIVRTLKSLGALAITLPIIACNYKPNEFDDGPLDAGADAGADAGDGEQSDGGDADAGVLNDGG